MHRLDDLTEEVAALVAPVRGEPFIVFHDAYRYFEDRFGLTSVGSAVVSEERSPVVRRIRELREKVRQSGAACVFSEPHFDQRLVITISRRDRDSVGTVDRLAVKVENGPEPYFGLRRPANGSISTGHRKHVTAPLCARRRLPAHLFVSVVERKPGST